MSDLFPFLEISGPDGQKFSKELLKEQIAIGRYASSNDIGLEPDPEKCVTRIAHCTLIHTVDGWWVIDNTSANGTSLKHDGLFQSVRTQTRLFEGDSICIPSRLPEDTPYWELTFYDPSKTKVIIPRTNEPYLEYSSTQAKLFRISGSEKLEILLRPNEHKLIYYMYEQNKKSPDGPAMCRNDDLLTAIWGDKPPYTGDSIKQLISGLRQKLELDPKQPKFIQTVRGMGYRLVMCPSK